MPSRLERRGASASGGGPGAGRATINAMDGARARLVADREETFGRLANLTGDYEAVVDASRDSNADDEHDPEGATIAFERSQMGSLISQTRSHLAEIESALERLRSGEYGTCESCGGAIGEGRLEARPVARTCIACAAKN